MSGTQFETVLRLSSGLPLEQVTANIIRKRDYLVQFEYPFLRYNERSEAGQFSIDLRAIKRYEDKGFSHVILAECKFRREGTQWLFVPNENDPPFDVSPPSVDFHNMYATAYLANASRSLTFSSSDYIFRGIEIKTGTGDNPSSLPTAINQIKYAFLESAIAHAKSNLTTFGLMDRVKGKSSSLRYNQPDNYNIRDKNA